MFSRADRIPADKQLPNDLSTPSPCALRLTAPYPATSGWACAGELRGDFQFAGSLDRSGQNLASSAGGDGFGGSEDTTRRAPQAGTATAAARSTRSAGRAVPALVGLSLGGTIIVVLINVWLLALLSVGR